MTRRVALTAQSQKTISCIATRVHIRFGGSHILRLRPRLVLSGLGRTNLCVAEPLLPSLLIWFCLNLLLGIWRFLVCVQQSEFEGLSCPPAAFSVSMKELIDKHDGNSNAGVRATIRSLVYNHVVRRRTDERGG